MNLHSSYILPTVLYSTSTRTTRTTRSYLLPTAYSTTYSTVLYSTTYGYEYLRLLHCTVLYSTCHLLPVQYSYLLRVRYLLEVLPTTVRYLLPTTSYTYEYWRHSPPAPIPGPIPGRPGRHTVRVRVRYCSAIICTEIRMCLPGLYDMSLCYVLERYVYPDYIRVYVLYSVQYSG